MTALENIFEFLRTDWDDFSSSLRKEFLNDAYDALLRIKSQIFSVLNYIEANEAVKTYNGQCSIEEIFEIVNELKNNLSLGKIDIFLEGIDKSDNISFPLSSMEMVLRELLTNSKKFHQNNSPHIEIKISSVPSGICFKICDDGSNLSPAQLADMWIPYNQSEKMFTGETPGMGLGLSIVASMVWFSGGTCKSYNRQDGPGIVIEIILNRKDTKGL
jgi:K+-sensing histidine kinase KdpD